jgi:hypothetical protein
MYYIGDIMNEHRKPQEMAWQQLTMLLFILCLHKWSFFLHDFYSEDGSRDFLPKTLGNIYQTLIFILYKIKIQFYIYIPNSSSMAMMTSTWSSESSPRSFMKWESSVSCKVGGKNWVWSLKVVNAMSVVFQVVAPCSLNWILRFWFGFSTGYAIQHPTEG